MKVCNVKDHSEEIFKCLPCDFETLDQKLFYPHLFNVTQDRAFKIAPKWVHFFSNTMFVSAIYKEMIMSAMVSESLMNRYAISHVLFAAKLWWQMTAVIRLSTSKNIQLTMAGQWHRKITLTPPKDVSKNSRKPLYLSPENLPEQIRTVLRHQKKCQLEDVS